MLSRVLAQETLPAEGTDDFEILVNFIALMTARVPATRTALAQPLEMLARMFADTMVVTPEHYRAAVERARRSGVDVPDVDYETMRDFVREHMGVAIPQAGHIKQLFQVVDILLPFLAARKWSLLIAEYGAGDFIASDDPVALTWTSTPALPGMAPPGFGLMETDVTFPLSKKLAILGRFEGEAGRFSADRARVAAINTRTGMYCVRFLCSPSEDFLWLKADGTVRGAADLVQEIETEAASP